MKKLILILSLGLFSFSAFSKVFTISFDLKECSTYKNKLNCHTPGVGEKTNAYPYFEMITEDEGQTYYFTLKLSRHFLKTNDDIPHNLKKVYKPNLPFKLKNSQEYRSVFYENMIERSGRGRDSVVKIDGHLVEDDQLIIELELLEDGSLDLKSIEITKLGFRAYEIFDFVGLF